MNKQDIQAAIDNELETFEKQFGSDCKLKLITIISLVSMLHPEKEEKQSKLIPISDWNEYHDYPTSESLYQKWHKREQNGFDYCAFKDGRRVIIDEDKYFEWVQRNRGVKV